LKTGKWETARNPNGKEQLGEEDHRKRGTVAEKRLSRGIKKSPEKWFERVGCSLGPSWFNSTRRKKDIQRVAGKGCCF